MLDRIRQNAQSWGVKIAFGLIIIVCVFWGVGSMDSGSGGTAIATVNGETISLNEFAHSYQMQVATVRQQMPHVSEEDLKAFGIRQQVLQTLIARTLLLQEAERMGIEVTPQEVKQSIAAIPSFHNEQGKQRKQMGQTQILHLACNLSVLLGKGVKVKGKRVIN